MMSQNYSDHIDLKGVSMFCHDWKKGVKVFPDNFFNDYTQIEDLNFCMDGLSQLPSSIGNLPNLKTLRLSGGRYKTFPESFNNLSDLVQFDISNNSMVDLNKEFAKGYFPNLKKLIIASFWGKQFPENCVLFKNLAYLEYNNRDKKLPDIIDIYRVLVQMPWLKSVVISDFNDVSEEILSLDFLDELTVRIDFETAPLYIGLLKHVQFKNNKQAEFNKFRGLCQKKNIPDDIRQILFGFYFKNYEKLMEILPDKLMEYHQQKQETGIVLLAKTKITKKRTLELFQNTNFKLLSPTNEKDMQHDHMVYVVGPDTEYHIIEKLLLEKKAIALNEHFRNLIVTLEDPWLMQDGNTGLNENLLQLLASNQYDNLKIAFNIIETGGADRTIQSMLAAIMLSSPQKDIARQAEKLYVRYGSSLFPTHAKECEASLRMSGNTLKKLDRITNHPDIDAFAFRLMHHVVAGNNLNISDIHPDEFKISGITEIPSIIKYFSIKKLDLRESSDLNLATAIERMKDMDSLESLNLSKLHVTIPATIATLQHLKSLYVAFNTFEDETVLDQLVFLTELDVEGCKLKSTDFIASLPLLTNLILNNNQLQQIPESVFKLKSLKCLHLKQNKLTVIDVRLFSMKTLNELDLSNNEITKFDYHILKTNIKELRLRSNKIKIFDPGEAFGILGSVVLALRILNLGSNQLQSLDFPNLSFSNLRELDISNNEITQLNESLFTNTKVRTLFAQKNKITHIPHIPYALDKLWLQGNLITALEEPFSKIRIGNCDLSNNKITQIHPAFQRTADDKFGWLYWKLSGNPFPEEVKKQRYKFYL